MPNVVIKDIDLYYETHGKGTPLMLISGLASDSQSWQPIIKDLSRHCLVITLDNRGVGRTKPQDIEISIQEIADDCIALIEYLGFATVNLLGHSMGGFVAMDLAIRYARYCNKLILAGTSASNSKRNNSLLFDWASCLESRMDPEQWFRNIFYWLFSARFFEDEPAVSDALRLAIEYPYPQSAIAFRNQVKAIANYNCTESLSKIISKTLVISGKEDILFPTEVASVLAQAIPNAVFSVLDKAAHSIHMEQPQIFTDCVLDFLLKDQ